MVEGVRRFKELDGGCNSPDGGNLRGAPPVVAGVSRSRRGKDRRSAAGRTREGSGEAVRLAIDAVRAEFEVADLRPNRQMCELLVAGEEHRIAVHPGVDPLALCRAAWRTYGRGRVEGGRPSPCSWCGC